VGRCNTGHQGILLVPCRAVAKRRRVVLVLVIEAVTAPGKLIFKKVGKSRSRDCAALHVLEFCPLSPDIARHASYGSQGFRPCLELGRNRKFIKLTTMKSKQLANVLIKMLGLSICVYAIPSFVEGVLVMLSGKPPTYFVTVLGISATAMTAIVQAIVGILIITKSQKIAGWMFKSEDE
jgi:hypothetical protein